MEPTERTISRMFDRISGRYDFLNHILSGFTDVRWRKKAVEFSFDRHIKKILDVSTGTGDMAIAYGSVCNDARIYGVDISMEMLKRAKIKDKRIKVIRGSGLSLPFKNGSFDLVSCAFGIRNIYPRKTGLQEFYRVLRPGGIVMILEFSMPTGMIRGLYRIYFEKIMPLLGNIISGTNAYTYLKNSVEAFPQPEVFGDMLNAAGFEDITTISLTHNVAVVYKGKK